MANRLEALERDLVAALSWLNELGLRAESTRFAHCLQAVRDLHNHRRADEQRQTRVLQQFISVLTDAYELVHIHRFLSRETGQEFKKRLYRFLKGPVREADETERSIFGRSIGFELTLACLLAGGGLEPEFPSDGDVLVSVNGHRVLIECKRPQERSRVDANLKEAVRQLESGALSHDGYHFLGMIAISIGKVIHGGQSILEAPSRQTALDRLSWEVQRFGEEHRTQIEAALRSIVSEIIVYLPVVVQDVETGDFFWTYTVGYQSGGNAPSEVFDRIHLALEAVPIY